MIKAVVVGGIFLAIGIAIIGTYLSPDDLSKCSTTPTGETGCVKVDAIVAVSGGNTSIRAAEAIRLYQAGWAKYIIFSGAAFDSTSPSNASVMRDQAIAADVPKKVILTEEDSRTTHENAENTNSLLTAYDITTVIVVTSPYHQRRAGIEFKNFAGSGVSVINHPAPNDPDWPWYWWVTPRGWWLAVGELVKTGVTKVGESK